MLNSRQIKKILQDIIPANDFDILNKEAKKNNKNLIGYLVEKKLISSSLFYEKVANFYKLPFIDLKNQLVRKDILHIIPEPISATHKIIAFDEEDGKLKIAALDPSNLEIFEFIRKKAGKEIQIFITTPENIKEATKQYHKTLKAEFDDLTNVEVKPNAEANLKEIAEDLPIVKIVETLLEYAIFEGASDIHIEPEEKGINVRYRVDGVLRTVMNLPKNVQPGVTARIKILANLKVDEHRMPQDGRIKISANEQNVSFRVSIMPTYDGEKIVMRLLNEQTQTLTLEQIGLQPSSLEAVKRNISKPHGMFLVTGPTGSGKSTTLYTVLNILNSPEVNISTIEDPIEYRIPRVNQSQINPKIGFTFAVGLRAFLRQDPDIIMVGEIRDEETAEIAVHAAMTGHLVLSTLHTNDAITTIPRLSEMGIAAFLVSSTLNIIIAQRLVRKICPNCIQSYNLDTATIEELNKKFDTKSILKKMEQEKIIGGTKKTFDTMLFYKGKGCKQCNYSGYKGRIGIYETLEVDDKLAELIAKKADRSQIQEYMDNKGMISMVEDGFIKAKNGITSIEEVTRVTKD